MFFDDPNSFKNVKLEGAALDAVRQYEAEMKRLDEAKQKAKDDMWAAICAATGLDPEGDYTIDREYLDEFGFAVVKVPLDDEDDEGEGESLDEAA